MGLICVKSRCEHPCVDKGPFQKQAALSLGCQAGFAHGRSLAGYSAWLCRGEPWSLSGHCGLGNCGPGNDRVSQVEAGYLPLAGEARGWFPCDSPT